jgi:NADH oxidase (H2O2-forming)
MQEVSGGLDPSEWSPRVVIVGGGVSGYSVARRLREDLPRARIHLYDKNDWHHYSACGMTFAVEGLYDLEQVVLHTPEDYDGLGVEVHEGVEVTGADLDGRTIQLSEGGEARFDVLVIATGRKALKPPVPGIDLPGVHTLSNYGDGMALMEDLPGASTAVVVGGGAIGLETAVALKARGLEVTVVEMLPHLLPQMLDYDTGMTVRDHVESLGVRVLTGVPVGMVEAGVDGRVGSVDVLGETISADLVVVSTGVRPETGLAEAAGFDLGNTGGVATDEHMRVLRGGEPVDRAYAVGDCAEVHHAVLGRSTLSPLASTALYEARTVSRHLVDPDHQHRPVVAPAVVVIGDLHVGCVGLTHHGGEYLGLGTWGLSAKGLDRSRYFPGAEDIHLRLVGDPSGNIVGAQAVGKRDVKERMNLMALVISEGIPAERLVDVERAYSPPVQLLADPLLGLLEDFIEAKASLSDQLPSPSD